MRKGTDCRLQPLLLISKGIKSQSSSNVKGNNKQYSKYYLRKTELRNSYVTDAGHLE